MDELEQKIIDIINYDDGNTIYFIKSFISKCSLSDFEKLKELDYDLSQSNETVKTVTYEDIEWLINPLHFPGI